MNYKIIDKETYYRKGVFRHFSEDCRCSASMTARIDVTLDFPKIRTKPRAVVRDKGGRIYSPLAQNIYFSHHALANYSSIGDYRCFQVFKIENIGFFRLSRSYGQRICQL